MSRDFQEGYHIKCGGDIAKMFIQNKQDLNFSNRSDEDFLLFLLYRTIQSLSNNFSDTLVLPDEMYTNDIHNIDTTQLMAPPFPPTEQQLIDDKQILEPGMAAPEHANDPNYQFECSKCKKRFRNKAYLQKHFKRCGPNALKRYHCQYCRVVTGSMGALTEHIRQLHRDVRFSCEICHKKFRSVEYVKHHVRVAHNKIKDHRCPQCFKTFTQRGSLKIHIQMVHQKMRTHICHICSKPFGCKSHLTRHISRMHSSMGVGGEEKHATCEICGDIFSSMHEFRLHVTDHHYHTEFICNLCNKVFKQKHTLTTHIARSHPSVRVSEHSELSME